MFLGSKISGIYGIYPLLRLRAFLVHQSIRYLASRAFRDEDGLSCFQAHELPAEIVLLHQNQCALYPMRRLRSATAHIVCHLFRRSMSLFGQLIALFSTVSDHPLDIDPLAGGNVVSGRRTTDPLKAVFLRFRNNIFQYRVCKNQFSTTQEHSQTLSQIGLECFWLTCDTPLLCCLPSKHCHCSSSMPFHPFLQFLPLQTAALTSRKASCENLDAQNLDSYYTRSGDSAGHRTTAIGTPSWQLSVSLRRPITVRTYCPNSMRASCADLPRFFLAGGR